jgi:HSP20 family protein
MTYMHYEPFRTLRDLDRVANQMLSGTRMPMSMPMDVWREGQTYHVELDLPGVVPASIDLQVERNTLTVSAQRQPSFGGGEGTDRQVVVAERPQGSFSRQLVLGEGLDSGAVQAEYTDGVLHLTIPVAQASQPRKINVTSGRSGTATAEQPGHGSGQPSDGDPADPAI